MTDLTLASVAFWSLRWRQPSRHINSLVFIELHPMHRNRASTATGLRAAPFASFDRLCGIAFSREPKENTISMTIHQGGIASGEQFLPSWSLCLLCLSSDVWPARGLRGLRGHREIVLCMWLLLIHSSGRTQRIYACSLQEVVTTRGRSATFYRLRKQLISWNCGLKTDYFLPEAYGCISN